MTASNSSEYRKTWSFKSCGFLSVTATCWSTLTHCSNSSNEPFLLISATFAPWSHPACPMPQVIAQIEGCYRGCKCQKLPHITKFGMLSHIARVSSLHRKGITARNSCCWRKHSFYCLSFSPSFCSVSDMTSNKAYLVLQNIDPEVLRFPAGFLNIAEAIWSGILICVICGNILNVPGIHCF